MCLSLNTLLIFFFLASQYQCLIPKPCAKNVTKHNAVCCPLNPHNHQVCGGENHGVCQRIVPPEESVPTIFLVDDRLGWPARFFQYACQCKGNYFGVACDECWFGWIGEKCNIKEKRVRKDIRSLSPRELFIFKDVVSLANTWPSGYVVLNESDNEHSDPLNDPKFEEASVQFFISFLHRYVSRTTLYKDIEDCELYGILDFAHDGPVFPTWHRYYMLLWERMLGQIASVKHGVHDFSNPYWDWAGQKDCDICNNKYIGGEGWRDDNGVRIHRDHPWHNLTEWCYEPIHRELCYGCQASGKMGKITRTWNNLDFPSQVDLDFAIKLKDYFRVGERDSMECKSFHMALEGFCGRPGVNGSMLWTHNRVHNMIDGSMCCGGTAANDPLFLLHHTYADKIFSIWYKNQNPSIEDYPQKGVRPGHCRDCFLVGLFPLVRNYDMFAPEESFGYKYDDYVIGRNAANGIPPMRY